MADNGRKPNYHEYLQLDRILGSQLPPDFASDDPSATRELLHHEEMLFIIMHQTEELWFKMMMTDVCVARDLLGRPGEDAPVVPEKDIPRACMLLERSAELFKHLQNQFTVLETMAPLHFLTFRDELIPASGFQSGQFRELEILTGLPENERLNYAGQPYDAALSPRQRASLAARREEMTLRQALFRWLARTPVDEAFPDFVEVFLEAYGKYIDEQLVHQLGNPSLSEGQRHEIAARFETSKDEARKFFTEGDDLVRSAHRAFVFISTYRSEPLLRWPYALTKRALEFEEHFRLFRFRHARMVERMIGLRVGTGGSSGVEYLDATASRYRIFGELLKATSYLIDPRRLPAVPKPEILGFRIQD